MDALNADDIIESTLVQANAELGRVFDSDVIFINCPMTYGIDDVARDEVEFIKERENSKNVLTVLLETTGGYIEVVERIVGVLRRHYTFVNFIVPNFAYSAGTVMVLSGDEIYMDYYSVLGPIDPQFTTETGEPVPGMGYIAKFNELIGTINGVSDDRVGEVKAEMSFILKKFDPAKLFLIEQAMEHSKALIKEWLPKYKFKNWDKTETRGISVTQDYKSERAEKIADKLADASHWHSHGRGIFLKDLESDDIGLKIKDFGAEPTQNLNIRHYHGLITDYMVKKGCKGAIHTPRGLRKVLP